MPQPIAAVASKTDRNVLAAREQHQRRAHDSAGDNAEAADDQRLFEHDPAQRAVPRAECVEHGVFAHVAGDCGHQGLAGNDRADQEHDEGKEHEAQARAGFEHPVGRRCMREFGLASTP